jgi:hypothetical protein
MDHEKIWLGVEEQPPERARHTIQDQKRMIIIAWNPFGFHLLDELPKGNTFNAEYHHLNILIGFLPFRSQVDGMRFVIHADNARSHIARKCQAFYEEKWLRFAVHPLHQPDPGPSDFLLFGHINHCLQGIVFPSCEKLLAAIPEIVGAILRPTLKDVFRHWMERLEWVPQNNAEYYP